MTAHTDTHAPEVAHDVSGLGADPRLQLAASLKIEPTELQDFELADKAAGQMMGKLLGFLFCVLIILMSGVNIWMIGHNSKGTDNPQGLNAAEASAGHH